MNMKLALMSFLVVAAFVVRTPYVLACHGNGGNFAGGVSSFKKTCLANCGMKKDANKKTQGCSRGCQMKYKTSK